MNKIQMLNKISTKGLEKSPLDKYEIGTEVVNPNAILVRSQNMLDMDLPESLLAVGRAGAGVNNIPLPKCTEKGIVAFNTPGANANAVKEIVVAGLLLSSRKIVDGINFAKTLVGKGAEVSAIVEKNKKHYAGSEIKGKKLGLIGLGAIGVMVANDALALGMEVEGFDPYISVEAAWNLSREVKKAKGLDDLIASSDYISLHVPLNDKTKGILNAERFGLMKKGVKILNFARGGLVNNADLSKAMADGVVSSYVTDFADEELLKMDNTICIPHLGASTDESEENCAMMVVKQIKDFIENGNIINSVNFPACSLGTVAVSRICIANNNVSGVVGHISTILADAKLNISEMLNKSKDDVAYTIVDIDGDVPEEVIANIAAVKDIIKVRLLKSSE